MKWLCSIAAITVLVLTGCGIQPSEVNDRAKAPTGVAPGVTLYFIDADGDLRPQLRRIGRLGTISEALTLLLLGPGNSNVRTEITSSTMQVGVTTTESTIELRLPLASEEVTDLGIDQIVCTALATHVQRGGSTSTRVRTLFTLPSPESEKLRTCPLIE